jgi:two-component system sensor histidine kinase KdpD
MSNIAKKIPETGPKSADTIREDLHRQILSTVSHDLKTPLATIIGSLEIYRKMYDKLSPEKRGSLIQASLSEAYRLDNFITNILDMTRLEAGTVRASPEACDMQQIIKDTITRLGPKGLAATVEITVTPPPVALVTDPMLLGRALGLVIENSLRHGSGGKEPVIEITAAPEADMYAVHVRDHGAGIPDNRLEDIFAKYTRYNNSDYQNAGTGLGLAITRELMTTISGNISAQNHPSGGALFALKFPQLAIKKGAESPF